MTTPIAHLKGIGPKSAEQLANIGIRYKEDLIQIGPIPAYNLLTQKLGKAPSLNMLYAMIGALENKHWTEIAQKERTSILLALDGFNDLQETLKNELTHASS